MKRDGKSLLVLLLLSFLFSCAQVPQKQVSEKPIMPTVDLMFNKYEILSY